MEDELLEKEETGSEAESESEVMHGGPGDEATDAIVNPPEGEVLTREGAVEAEGAPPKFKFKDQAAAEKAHSEAMKKMHEATEELSRYRKMLSTVQPTRTEQARPVRKAVWQREKEEFETRKKQIPMPDLRDAEAVTKYNDQVMELYFQTHEKYTGIAQEERTAARDVSTRMQGWISVEAKKYGIDDTPFELRNEDGTTEQGTLENVFWSVAKDPESFGISLRSADGKFLPLDRQVEVIARGINRFIDAIIIHRQNLAKRNASEKRDLTVLRRGSSGPSRKKGEEEEESISTFAEGIKENMKNRRRVGSLRRQGED